jgi:hypothetical protein
MTKKYSTLRVRLREQIKAEGKPTRTYKRREPGEIKESNHVTQESLALRHQYCITVEEILREKARAIRLGKRYDIKDEDIRGVCNHPNDGVCGRNFTDEQVKEVNARLGGASGDEQDLENPNKESQPRSRKPRRTKAEKPPAKYFCTKHEAWHFEPDKEYAQDMKFKRGRGRPSRKT